MGIDGVSASESRESVKISQKLEGAKKKVEEPEAKQAAPEEAEAVADKGQASGTDVVA